MSLSRMELLQSLHGANVILEGFMSGFSQALISISASCVKEKPTKGYADIFHQYELYSNRIFYITADSTSTFSFAHDLSDHVMTLKAIFIVSNFNLLFNRFLF